MKYRAKLYFALVAIAMAASLLGIGILYAQTKRYVKKDLRAKVLSVATTTAALIDYELIEKIQSTADLDTPAFKELKLELKDARDDNRREDVYIEFLYIVRPLKKQSSRI